MYVPHFGKFWAKNALDPFGYHRSSYSSWWFYGRRTKAVTYDTQGKSVKEGTKKTKIKNVHTKILK